MAMSHNQPFDNLGWVQTTLYQHILVGSIRQKIWSEYQRFTLAYVKDDRWHSDQMSKLPSRLCLNLTVLRNLSQLWIQRLWYHFIYFFHEGREELELKKIILKWKWQLFKRTFIVNGYRNYLCIICISN